MNDYRLRNENLKNIKAGFLAKIRSDSEYIADAPRYRFFRKSSIAVVAAAVIVLSTAIYAMAAGFDPLSAWQNLFEKKQSIAVGEQVTSSGISMNVQKLYTDGDHAILKMKLRDLAENRLYGNIGIATIDKSRYTAYLEDCSYNTETGETTCIVRINFREKVMAGDTFAFEINSITVNQDYSDDFHSFDYDLYEAALSSKLRPTASTDDWIDSARANPVPAIVDPDYTVRRGGVMFNSETKEFGPMNWLPLDTAVQGVKLIHWLSVLGVGYENGSLHIQLRYDDLFGFNMQYISPNPALIDDEGNILEATGGKHGEWELSGEILYCGYKELRFDVGDIENLKKFKLAWTGNYVDNVIDGSWSVDISLDDIGNSISGSAELTSHPDFTSVSYKLSPLFLETEIHFPAHSLDKNYTHYNEDGMEIKVFGFDEDKIQKKIYEKELKIVLKNGTEIEPAFDRLNFCYGGDASNGKTQITSWHLLDGSFDIEDVTEIIIFGVRFPFNNT